MKPTNTETVIADELPKIQNLECDGATRVLHYALDKAGIKHQTYHGLVKFNGKVIPLHYWIELSDGRILDYKLRMWLGADAPEGIFEQKGIKYSGVAINLLVNETLYNILTFASGGEIQPHKEVSASKTVATKEVAEKYGLSEMEAAFLYQMKEKNIYECDYEEGLKKAMFEKLKHKGFLEYEGYANGDFEYILPQKSNDFISALEARIETRRGVKAGYDLFPEQAAIPEFKSVAPSTTPPVTPSPVQASVLHTRLKIITAKLKTEPNNALLKTRLKLVQQMIDKGGKSESDSDSINWVNMVELASRQMMQGTAGEGDFYIKKVAKEFSKQKNIFANPKAEEITFSKLKDEVYKDKIEIFIKNKLTIQSGAVDWFCEKFNLDKEEFIKRAKGSLKQYAEGGLINGLTAEEAFYLWVKRGLKAPYREKYLRPLGLFQTDKSKAVEDKLKKIYALNGAGAITEQGKELAKQIDVATNGALSRIHQNSIYGVSGNTFSDKFNEFDAKYFLPKLETGGNVGDRFFEVSITEKWKETPLEYMHGRNHAEVAAKLPLRSKRITNERFREIEQTGSYYRVEEVGKGGKAFIFEILEPTKLAAGGAVEAKRNIWVRFNLSNDENFMKWKIENKETGAVTYLEPSEVQIVMYNCKLTNSPATAQKIFTGQMTKAPIAYVRCESAEILYSSTYKIKEEDWLKYNPRKAPNWQDSVGNNIDNTIYPRLITKDRGVYVYHKDNSKEKLKYDFGGEIIAPDLNLKRGDVWVNKFIATYPDQAFGSTPERGEALDLLGLSEQELYQLDGCKVELTYLTKPETFGEPKVYERKDTGLIRSEYLQTEFPYFRNKSVMFFAGKKQRSYMPLSVWHGSAVKQALILEVGKIDRTYDEDRFKYACSEIQAVLDKAAKFEYKGQYQMLKDLELTGSFNINKVMNGTNKADIAAVRELLNKFEKAREQYQFAKGAASGDYFEKIKSGKLELGKTISLLESKGVAVPENILSLRGEKASEEVFRNKMQEIIADKLTAMDTEEKTTTATSVLQTREKIIKAKLKSEPNNSVLKTRLKLVQKMLEGKSINRQQTESTADNWQAIEELLSNNHDKLGEVDRLGNINGFLTEQQNKDFYKSNQSFDEYVARLYTDGKLTEADAAKIKALISNKKSTEKHFEKYSEKYLRDRDHELNLYVTSDYPREKVGAILDAIRGSEGELFNAQWNFGGGSGNVNGYLVFTNSWYHLLLSSELETPPSPTKYSNRTRLTYGDVLQYVKKGNLTFKVAENKEPETTSEDKEWAKRGEAFWNDARKNAKKLSEMSHNEFNDWMVENHFGFYKDNVTTLRYVSPSAEDDAIERLQNQVKGFVKENVRDSRTEIKNEQLDKIESTLDASQPKNKGGFEFRSAKNIIAWLRANNNPNDEQNTKIVVDNVSKAIARLESTVESVRANPNLQEHFKEFVAEYHAYSDLLKLYNDWAGSDSYKKIATWSYGKNEILERIKNQPTPYGVDRVVGSYLKNGTGSEYERDLAIVEGNPNYNAPEKFNNGLVRFIYEQNEKADKIEADNKKWAKTGGYEYISKFPKYKQNEEDILAHRYLAEVAETLKKKVEPITETKKPTTPLSLIHQINFPAFLSHITLRNNSSPLGKQVEVMWFDGNGYEILFNIPNSNSESKDDEFNRLQLEKYHQKKVIEAMERDEKIEDGVIEFYQTDKSLLVKNYGGAAMRLALEKYALSGNEEQPDIDELYEAITPKVLKYAYEKGDEVNFYAAGNQLVKAKIKIPSVITDAGVQVWLTTKGFKSEDEMIPAIVSAAQTSSGGGYKMFKGLGGSKYYEVKFADGDTFTSYRSDRASAIDEAIKHRLYHAKDFPKTKFELPVVNSGDSGFVFYSRHELEKMSEQKIKELSAQGFKPIADVLPVVTERDYYMATQADFEKIDCLDFDIVDAPIIESPNAPVIGFKSQYKYSNGFLYRKADHWKLVGDFNCSWSINPEAEVGEVVCGKVRFSEMKRIPDGGVILISEKFSSGGSIPKYEKSDLDSFAATAKFKKSEHFKYLFFNIGNDTQIRIKEAEPTDKGNFEITLHEIDEDGATFRANPTKKAFAFGIEAAKIEAAKIYYDEVRADVSTAIDIADRQIDFSHVPTVELKKLGEKSSDFSEMAAIKRELDSRKLASGGIITTSPEQQKIIDAKPDEFVTVYHASSKPLQFIQPSDSSNYAYAEKGFVYVAVTPENAAGYIRLHNAVPYVHKIKIKKEELLPDKGMIKAYGGKNTLEESISRYGLARIKRPVYGNEIESVEQYSKGGSLVSAPLLAPNGKPSKLNPIQYALVRTPEFKAWFGDWEKLASIKLHDSGIDEISLANLSDGVSKVIDENGEPMVVYRGQRGTFEEHGGVFNYGKKFMNNKKKPNMFGFFFTVDWQAAENYAYNDFPKFGYILECFLNVKKLADLTALSPVVPENVFNLRLRELGLNDMPKGSPKFNQVWALFDKGGQDLRLNFMWTGYNGVVFIDDSARYEKAIVVFSSSQIKPADGTNQTFEGGNADIRYAIGGEIMSRSQIESALHDVDYAPSVKYWMQPEFSTETAKYPQKGEPNSFKRLAFKGTVAGGKKWASDDIVAYDANGDIVGSISIDNTLHKGALKIVVRENSQRVGWGTKLLDEAEREGIEIIFKANSYTSTGRALAQNWLEQKLKSKHG
jgi:hypothetical protein